MESQTGRRLSRQAAAVTGGQLCQAVCASAAWCKHSSSGNSKSAGLACSHCTAALPILACSACLERSPAGSGSQQGCSCILSTCLRPHRRSQTPAGQPAAGIGREQQQLQRVAAPGQPTAQVVPSLGGCAALLGLWGVCIQKTASWAHCCCSSDRTAHHLLSRASFHHLNRPGATDRSMPPAPPASTHRCQTGARGCR